MFCSNCGAEMPNGSCFCGLCGAAASAPGVGTAAFAPVAPHGAMGFTGAPSGVGLGMAAGLAASTAAMASTHFCGMCGMPVPLGVPCPNCMAIQSQNHFSAIDSMTDSVDGVVESATDYMMLNQMADTFGVQAGVNPFGDEFAGVGNTVAGVNPFGDEFDDVGSSIGDALGDAGDVGGGFFSSLFDLF